MATLHKKFSFWNKFSWFLFVGVYGILRIEIQRIIHFTTSQIIQSIRLHGICQRPGEKRCHTSVFSNRESLLLATIKQNNPYTKRKFIETIYLRKIKQVIILNFQSHNFFLSIVRYTLFFYTLYTYTILNFPLFSRKWK